MRTIAVSGTASGLGLAIRRRLEGAGTRVIGIDRQEADVVADLGTRAGVAAAIAAVRSLSGGTLDGLVSCAALGPYDQPEPIVRVNYFGAIGLVDGLRDLARGREAAASRDLLDRRDLRRHPRAALPGRVLRRRQEAARRDARPRRHHRVLERETRARPCGESGRGVGSSACV
jgi:NAD(P)-dependent dehydrogenase (short-subunit alcohol dehydrogenase family)